MSIRRLVLGVVFTLTLGMLLVPVGASARGNMPDTASGTIAIDSRLCETVPASSDPTACPALESIGTISLHTADERLVLTMADATVHGGTSVWGETGLVPWTTYFIDVSGLAIPDGYQLWNIVPEPGTIGGGSEMGWAISISADSINAKLHIVLVPAGNGPDTPSGTIAIDTRLCESVPPPSDPKACPALDSIGSVSLHTEDETLVLTMADATTHGGTSIWGETGVVPWTTYFIDVAGLAIPDGYELWNIVPEPGTNGGGSEMGWYIALSGESFAAHLHVVLVPSAPTADGFDNSITLYELLCPAGYVGKQHDNDCTETRADRAFTVVLPGTDFSTTTTTDANGSAVVAGLGTGTFHVLTDAADSDAFLVRCSAAGDIEPRQLEELPDGVAVTLDPDDDLTCTWFTVPTAAEGTSPTPAITLPNTGAGIAPAARTGIAVTWLALASLLLLLGGATMLHGRSLALQRHRA